MRTLLFAAMLSVALAGAATSAQAHTQPPRHILRISDKEWTLLYLGVCPKRLRC
jgi:hypothetical protein